MHVDQIRYRMWLGASGVFLLSLLVVFADRAGLLNSFRPVLHDALSPGRLMILAVSAAQSTTGRIRDAEDAQPEKSDVVELRQKELLLRQLMIENARLRRDLKLEKTSTNILQAIEPISSLTEYRLIPATVISASGLPSSLRDLIIDAGKSAGITRSELVLSGDGPVLDTGLDQSVRPGDRVLSGVVVVGRIEKAARWVSLVQPVTASGFKAQVMLLRQTADGLHFGATGMLEGQGESECIITGIPHTEAVAVGDDVVSAEINGVRGPQLYFGRVVRADFLAGGQWDVHVRPAASFNELETVSVLKLRLVDTAAEGSANEIRAHDLTAHDLPAHDLTRRDPQ